MPFERAVAHVQSFLRRSWAVVTGVLLIAGTITTLVVNLKDIGDWINGDRAAPNQHAEQMQKDQTSPQVQSPDQSERERSPSDDSAEENVLRNAPKEPEDPLPQKPESKPPFSDNQHIGTPPLNQIAQEGLEKSVASPDAETEERGAVPQAPVRVGFTRLKFRRMHGVRAMKTAEDGKSVSDLSRVYGYASAATLSGIVSRLHHDLMIVHKSRARLAPIELHVLEDRNLVVLVYVSKQDADRLGSPAGDIGNLAIFDSNDQTVSRVLVGIPDARIDTWEIKADGNTVIRVN